MLKHFLLSTVALLITAQIFTMDQNDQQPTINNDGWATYGQYITIATTPFKPIPSLLTLSQHAIVHGNGNADLESYKKSAKLIMTLHEKCKNESLRVDENVRTNCTNEYTKRCWGEDTGHGINRLLTEKETLVPKIRVSTSFQEHKFRPLLIKNTHIPNTYTTAKDNNLCIIDIDAQKIQKELTGHTNFIRCCATSTHKGIIISGAADQTIKIWDLSLNSGKSVKTLWNNATPRNLATKGTTFCSLSWDYPTLRVRDLSTCKEIFSKHITYHLGYFTSIHPISLMMKKKMIYIGMEGAKADIIAIDRRSGQQAYEWNAHTNRITSLIPCNRDTNSLYSGSLDGSIKQWDQRKLNGCIKKIQIAENKNGCFPAATADDEIINHAGIEGLHESQNGTHLFATDSNNIVICDVLPDTLKLKTRLYLDYKTSLSSSDMAMNDEETKLYIPTHYKGILTVTPNYIVEEFDTLVTELNAINCEVQNTEHK